MIFEYTIFKTLPWSIYRVHYEVRRSRGPYAVYTTKTLPMVHPRIAFKIPSPLLPSALHDVLIEDPCEYRNA